MRTGGQPSHIFYACKLALVPLSPNPQFESMSRSALLSEILDLPAEDRLQLVESIWDSLAASAESVPVPEWHQAELDDRLGDPDERATVSWEEVQARLRKPEL